MTYSHLQYIGCRTGDLRTVRGDNPGDIRLYPLYCDNGEWRRICTGGTWIDNSARVACRQLGYSGLSKFEKEHKRYNEIMVLYVTYAVIRGFNCPGSVSDLATVRLSAVCTGTESRIQDCGIETATCGCGAHAWLVCQTGELDKFLILTITVIYCLVCTDWDVRLVNGFTSSEGRVEVCVNGRWGTVCNNNQQLAEIACSLLGFLSEGRQKGFEDVHDISFAGATTVNSTFNLGFQPIINCTVQDEGTFCSLITDASCDHSMDLVVVCRTYEQLYNELLEQRSSTDLSLTCPTTCPTTESSDNPTLPPPNMNSFPLTNRTGDVLIVCNNESNISTVTFGVVVGVLVAVIVAMVIGWICTCVILKRQSMFIPSKNG